MSNKQKLMMINRVIEKTGLQVGSPLWYKLIALSVDGVKEVSIETNIDPSIDATIRFLPYNLDDVDKVKQDLIQLFESDEYCIYGHRIEVKCAYYE